MRRSFDQMLLENCHQLISTTAVVSKVEDAPHMEEVLGIVVQTSYVVVGMVFSGMDGLQVAF